MNREEAIYFANCLKNNYTIDLNDMEAFCDMAIKALEQEPTTKNNLGVDLISRADAIRAMQDKAKKLTNEDTINGLCGAVAILFDLPSVTPRPCDDAVSRKDVVKILGKIEQRVFDGEGFDYEESRAEIDELPSVTPQEPKTGHWIDNECTNCGYEVEPWNNTNYCPNCGAKMESEKVEYGKID